MSRVYNELIEFNTQAPPQDDFSYLDDYEYPLEYPEDITPQPVEEYEDIF